MKMLKFCFVATVVGTVVSAAATGIAVLAAVDLYRKIKRR